jgi:hypothetical protein
MKNFTIKNNKTYTAGLRGPISQYDNYLENAQKMINLVEITEVNTEKGNDGNGSSLTTANTSGSLILVNNLTIKRIFWLLQIRLAKGEISITECEQLRRKIIRAD